MAFMITDVTVVAKPQQKEGDRVEGVEKRSQYVFDKRKHSEEQG